MKTLFILIALILSGNSTVIGQTFRNLDFSQQCDTSKTRLCFWDLSWGGPGACIPEGTGKDRHLLITGKTVGSVGFAEQTASFKKTTGLEIIEVSAKISSEDIEGKGAGLNIGIYDSNGNLLNNKDMGYSTFSWVHGNDSRKKYTLKAICPPGTAKIKIGAILYGKGRAGFGDFSVIITKVNNAVPSKLAIRYISAVCDTISKHSLVKDSINIGELKNNALRIAGNARKYEDCYLAVEYLLLTLRSFGDYHSFLMKTKEVSAWENDGPAGENIPYAQYKKIDDYGYIMVPGFHSGNKKLINAFADTIQYALKKLENSGIKGWIIDLRKNDGGNMEPMIAGLGPIFDSEKLGSLVDVYGKKESWCYKNGDYCWQGKKVLSVLHPIALSSHLPIAVLTGPVTGSSGEIVAISFIGNGNTKFFGQPTWGLTTGNGAFDLMDGARIMLASTVMADRNGRLYQNRIQPDEIINDDHKTLDTAIGWLKKN